MKDDALVEVCVPTYRTPAKNCDSVPHCTQCANIGSKLSESSIPSSNYGYVSYMSNDTIDSLNLLSSNSDKISWVIMKQTEV